MKNVSIEKLIDLCNTMDLDSLKAWAESQLAEEKARALVNGQEIVCNLSVRDTDGSTSTKPVQARPLGKFFAIHNPGGDYVAKGKKDITHLPSGLSLVRSINKPMAAIVAAINELEGIDGIGWEQVDPAQGARLGAFGIVREILDTLKN